MSRFNVGDKVKIVKTTLGSQREYIGSVREVVNTDSDGVFLDKMPDDDDYYLDSELALIEPNVDSLYPQIVQPNFKLSEEIEEEWKKYVNGIWDIKAIKNEEEKDMNKVLELWFEEKREKIIEKYDTLEREYCTKQYGMVEDFNNLVNQFNEDLEELYNFDKESCQNVLCTNAPTNVIKYKIDYDKLGEEFKKQYGKEREEELKELARTKCEVEAQLSLSNDLKYTQEVLERYNIINKKTKKISV